MMASIITISKLCILIVDVVSKIMLLLTGPVESTSFDVEVPIFFLTFYGNNQLKQLELISSWIEYQLFLELILCLKCDNKFEAAIVCSIKSEYQMNATERVDAFIFSIGQRRYIIILHNGHFCKSVYSIDLGLEKKIETINVNNSAILPILFSRCKSFYQKHSWSIFCTSNESNVNGKNMTNI